MKSLLLCLTATAALSFSASLRADDTASAPAESPWTVGVSASDYIPANKSSPFYYTPGNQANPFAATPATLASGASSLVTSGAVRFSSFVYPEFNLGYKFSDNLSATLAATFPQRSTVSFRGAEGTLGTVDVLPATLTGKYSFFPGALINPYIGAGVTEIFITRESNLNAKAGLPVAFRSPNFGEVFEVGANVKLIAGFTLNVSARKALDDSRLTVEGFYASKLDLDPLILSVGISHRF